MLIEGPLKIAVLDQPELPGRELHITFREEFQALAPDEQVDAFRRYLLELAEGVASLSEDDPNRAGMLIVQQIGEQFLPVIAAGEMPLDETIVVEMGRDESALSLMDLLG